MADYAFKGFDNSVLSNKIESILSTKMDMNKYMTADYSLSQEPGMVKKIHKYTPSGAAEDLARGDGLQNYVDAEYIEEEYRVARTQAGAKWYDDDQMTDPVLIDTKVNGVAEVMVNNWTAKAIGEFDKTTNQSIFTNYELANWADAIAVYANEYEDQSGLFFLCNMKLVPTIRKALGDYLKYTEAYIRTGAIGEILGVPIYTSKAIPEDIMYLATKDAVTAFMKRDVFVEQDRDIDKKENRMIAARWTVIALTDESKCIKCGKAQATTATITSATKAQKVVSGAATTGATVTVFVNGVQDGNAETAASSAYSHTCADNLVAGDIVKIHVTLDKYLDQWVSFTVAE